MFDIFKENGDALLETDVSGAREKGFTTNEIRNALFKQAETSLLTEIDRYRQRLSGTEAGVSQPGPERVVIWAAKARIARAHAGAPDQMPEMFKAHMEREAAARGRNLDEQVARIIAKADMFESLGLMIDAMEAEAKAGLSSVSDEQALEGGFDAYLAGLKAQADAAFSDAIQALAG